MTCNPNVILASYYQRGHCSRVQWFASQPRARSRVVWGRTGMCRCTVGRGREGGRGVFPVGEMGMSECQNVKMSPPFDNLFQNENQDLRYKIVCRIANIFDIVTWQRHTQPPPFHIHQRRRGSESSSTTLSQDEQVASQAGGESSSTTLSQDEQVASQAGCESSSTTLSQDEQVASQAERGRGL